MSTPITIARGDGIGPEIMEATLRILSAAGADLEIEEIEIGTRIYERGVTSGIEPHAWESLRRTRVFLKSPITTPLGGGFKSLNVTVRKSLGLYANVRPCPTYHPFVETPHPSMDVVIIRENEEDLYAGIEHRQTDEVYQCLKLITRPGTERIVRYAFEYARARGRRKVTCFTKDNIMKLTDGLFHRVFDEVALEYPEIESEHMIIDIGTAFLANHPDRFDVIVAPNLYGDIISDVAAEVSGSVGLAGSANIGDDFALFEAVHGSAPGIAGQNLANPSGLLLAAVQMLVHIGQGPVAERVHNAWLATLEAGIRTADMRGGGFVVGTQEFSDAVIARIGRRPSVLAPVSYATTEPIRISVTRSHGAIKALVGVDVFLHWWDGTPDELGAMLSKLGAPDLSLQMITNRGVKVFPDGLPETFCTDHWRCRFQAADPLDSTVPPKAVLALLERVIDAGYDVIKTENLYTFDGQPGYSLGQGQ